MRILPITKALLKWLEEYYSIPADPGFVVISPSGVDLERYENAPDPTSARKELDLPEKITVGYTGHLYPGRGLDLMLELARTNSDIQLLWAGGEPAAIERWRTRIQRSGVENLQILGFVPNEQLPLIQAACDILLLPHERRVSASSGGDIAAFTSPMKLFEYMAAGRTILASDLPVLREVLNEKNAAFAPPGSVDSWNAELRSLVKDEGRRNALAKQAQEDAKKYTWVVRAKKSLDGIGTPHG
jgi:glycosyltransferase involved in cell wall biosynthesis